MSVVVEIFLHVPHDIVSACITSTHIYTHTYMQVLNNLDRLLSGSTPSWVVLVCGENDIAGSSSARGTFDTFSKVQTYA